jgi:putative DNA primase/helicase
LLTPIEVQKGARFAFTDDGNASRFAEDHHGELVYVYGPGWHRWTGRRWKAIPNEDVLKDARTSARKIRKEAIAAADHDHDASMRALKWAHSSESAGRLQSMVKLAQGGDDLDHADLKIDVEDLDRNLDILNTPSGVVNLRTGKLLGRSSGKDEYCTRITRAGYDPNADQSEWLKFLERVVPDPKIRAALKRCAGAAITGHTPKAMFALVGAAGDNGKTQVLEAFSGALGSYAGSTMESTFTNADSREAGYQLAELRAVRFVSFSETREGRGLATERVKRITGGDTITARAPAGKPFDYKPQFSIFMATNHPPIIPAREKAMWKRVWAYPFDVVIPKKEQIPDYGDQLVREHGEAILAWMVEGAREFYKAKCKLGRQPAAMEDRRETWRDRDDLVKRWIDDRVEKRKRASRRAADFWKDFRHWCEDNGEEVALRDYRAQVFQEEMDEHFPGSRGGAMQGSFARRGIVLKEAS